MKQLIVNADDFGYAPGINRGILEAHHTGIVTSTTVMINYPDAVPGLESALRDAPNLGIGLHFNLTSGLPVLPPDQVRTLIDDQGRFRHINQWAAHLAAIDPTEIRAEINAQFDRFQALTGRLPDHFDAHHHVTYLHPVALDTMLTLAERHHLPLRNGRFTAPVSQLTAQLNDLLPGLPSDTAHALLEEVSAVLAAHPAPRWPARLETGFFGAHVSLGELLIILTTLPDDSITELLCHPGYVDDALSSSHYQSQRETELQQLTARATRECVASENIELINFADLDFADQDSPHQDSERL